MVEPTRPGWSHDQAIVNPGIAIGEASPDTASQTIRHLEIANVASSLRWCRWWVAASCDEPAIVIAVPNRVKILHGGNTAGRV